MKAYTSFNQSKKLAEILPHNTADNIYERVVIAGCNLDIPEDKQYIHRDIPFIYFSGVGIPCWSLAALLDYIKDNCGYFKLVYINSKDVYRLSINVYDAYNKELVDACYEMILVLHE